MASTTALISGPIGWGVIAIPLTTQILSHVYHSYKNARQHLDEEHEVAKNRARKQKKKIPESPTWKDIGSRWYEYIRSPAENIIYGSESGMYALHCIPTLRRINKNRKKKYTKLINSTKKDIKNFQKKKLKKEICEY